MPSWYTPIHTISLPLLAPPIPVSGPETHGSPPYSRTDPPRKAISIHPSVSLIMTDKNLQEAQQNLMKPLKMYNKPKLLFSHVTQHTLDPSRNMDTEFFFLLFSVSLLAFTVLDHVGHIDAGVGWVPARWATPRACTLHLRPASPASRAFKSRGRVLS